MTLEQLLRDADARNSCVDREYGIVEDRVRYHETINPDALDGSWLNKRTSYVWKIGALVRIDGNKCDYAHVYLGTEKEPGNMCYHGCLNFPEGENDDMARVIDLWSRTLAACDSVFLRPSEPEED